MESLGIAILVALKWIVAILIALYLLILGISLLFTRVFWIALGVLLVLASLFIWYTLDEKSFIGFMEFVSLLATLALPYVLYKLLSNSTWYQERRKEQQHRIRKALGYDE